MLMQRCVSLRDRSGSYAVELIDVPHAYILEVFADRARMTYTARVYRVESAEQVKRLGLESVRQKRTIQALVSVAESAAGDYITAGVVCGPADSTVLPKPPTDAAAIAAVRIVDRAKAIVEDGSGYTLSEAITPITSEEYYAICQC